MENSSIRENGDRVIAAAQQAAQAAATEVSSWQQVTASMALRAAGLGFVGGLRSLTPQALLNWTRADDPPPDNQFESFLESTPARILLNSLAAGELVGDKLPFVPSRLSPPPLLGRLGLGMLAGVGVARRYRQPVIAGAVLGGLGAGVGSVAGYYARDAIASRTKAPQWLLGLAEDGVALGLGFLILRRP